MARKPGHKTFNLVLSPTHRRKLAAIAEHNDLNQAQVLRQLVQVRHDMDIDLVPTCANCQKCLVPHMHPVNLAKRPDAEPTEPPPPDEAP